MPTSKQRARSLLLDAAVHPEKWDCALAAIAEACGAGVGQFIVRHVDGRILSHRLTGIREGFATEVEAFGLADPAVNPRAELGLVAPLMTPILDQDFVSVETRRTLPIYAEMFDPADVPYNCQAVLMRGDALVRVSVSRNDKQGPFDAAAVRAFSDLMPAMHATVRLQMAFGHERLATALATLNSSATPAFVVDETGRMLAVSIAAEVLLRIGALRLASGQIVLFDPADADAFNAHLGHALRCAKARVAIAMAPLVVRAPNGGALQIDCHALTSDRDVLGSEPAVLVVVQPMEARKDPIDSHVAQLTQTEADVARRLARGQDIAAIATARGVSKATVRSQVQSIFMKLGVRRQAELVRLLSSPR